MRLIIAVFLCFFVTACNLQQTGNNPTSSPVTTATSIAQRLIVQDVIPDLEDSTELMLFYRWEGLAPRAPYEVKTDLDLTILPTTSVLSISIGGVSEDAESREFSTELSQEQLSSAIDLLKQIELSEEEYKPTFTHTDDYPTLSMSFVLDKTTIVFRTTSQGEKHLPWQLLVDGNSYVILSEEIFTVWQIFQPTLKPEELEAAVNSN